jgi:hypothetical protein
VHTLGSPRNSPEMLDPVEPKSGGFSVRPLRAPYRRKAPTQPHDAAV